VSIRNVYGAADVVRPYIVGGKQQRDPKTGAALTIALPSIILEFDSFSNYQWGFGNGVTNATSNLLNNCWGALTSKVPWLGKKYHMSGCTAAVGISVAVLPNMSGCTEALGRG
jgi:hypothetical protein